MDPAINITILIILALFVINFGLKFVKNVLRLVFSPAGLILGGIALVIFIFGS